MKALVAHVFSAAAATYSLILQASWANDWLKLMRLKSPKWWYFCNWNKNLKLLRTCVEQMLFVIMKYQAKAWATGTFCSNAFCSCKHSWVPVFRKRSALNVCAADFTFLLHNISVSIFNFFFLFYEFFIFFIIFLAFFLSIYYYF